MDTNKPAFLMGIIVLLAISAGSLASPAARPVQAQSTGDTLRLPSVTPTPRPTVIPQPVASLEVVPSPPTPNPVIIEVWEGRVASEVAGAGVPFARLLVEVTGRDGQQVRLSTMDQVINAASTGQKPNEIGPNTVEFTGLTPGRYIIDPLGLDTSFAVDLRENVETRVIFSQRQPTVTPFPTTTETSTSFPLSTFTSVAPTATDTPTPSPTPSATPATIWIGAVTGRNPDGPALLTVKIAGIEGMAVRLTRTDGEGHEGQRCVTGQDGYGQESCGFTNLSAGWYMVAPEGIDIALPVNLSMGGAAQVEFSAEVMPFGFAGWEAHVAENSNGFLAQSRTDSTIRVKLPGRAGQVVALHAVRLGTSRYCETVSNPVLGAPICEFDRLGPGVYRVEPPHRNAEQRLFVDGVGLAVIEFLPATHDVERAGPVVGHGARPIQPQPAEILGPPTSTASQLPPTATSTPTTSPPLQPTNTPKPAAAWQGRVVEQGVIGAGAIGVRVVGLKDHPVILRSGSWQSAPQLTGTKPELGEYATEFGGLAQGEYIVDLVELAQVKVNLGSGEFQLVEFRYEPVSTP